jgi:hypothetical protein
MSSLQPLCGWLTRQIDVVGLSHARQSYRRHREYDCTLRHAGVSMLPLRSHGNNAKDGRARDGTPSPNHAGSGRFGDA